MSTKYNSFLATTCLSVLALSVCFVTTPAKAGFEWTPPEQEAPKPIPEPEITRPEITPETSALPVVEPEKLAPPREPAATKAPKEKQESAKKPVLKVKVLNNNPPKEEKQEQEAPKDITPAPTVHHLGVKEKAEIKENIAAKEPAPAELKPEGLKQEDMRQVEETPTSAPTATKKKGLTINPYPLQDADNFKASQKSMGKANIPDQESIEWGKSKYEIVEGFGSDIPLAIALRQVVPAQYAFSFDKGVNLGALVSWEGGKPWDQILNNMIKPLNVKAVITKKAVHIVMNSSPATQSDKRNNKGEDESSALSPLPTKGEPASLLSSDKQNIPAASEDTNIQKQATNDTEGLNSAKNANLNPKASQQAGASDNISDKSGDLQKKEKLQNQKFQPRIWEAKQGSSLKETLDSWSKQANVKLLWMADSDYKLSNNVLISGTFNSAINVLFANAVNNPPQHRFVEEPENSLVVENKTL